MRTTAALLAFLWVFAPAQEISKLPDWAQGPARDGIQAAAPENADAWVLLDRTEFAYLGDGEIRQRHLRLVRILTERGFGESVYVLYGLGGSANKVKRIKGWNCRPDGEVTRLDKNDIVAVDADSAHEITTGFKTGAVLDRVVKGSLVAFESQEIFRYVTGPAGWVGPLEQHPVRLWEFEMGKSEGWFTNLKQVEMDLTIRNFKPWLDPGELRGLTSVRLRDLPPLPKGESAIPDYHDVLPRIEVRFLDPQLKDTASLTSWNALAAWFESRYRERSPVLKLADGISADPAAGLIQGHAWITRQTTYRQIYLSPERGWIPEFAEEVRRKRYGDCKDLACLMSGFVRSLGLESYPALARIGNGHLAEDEPINSGAFNHVISAIALPRSLGHLAEIDTPKGRFLLVDMTARYTPFGLLPEGHRNRRLMICLPDGALWVTVPEKAVQRPGVDYALQGSLDSAGRMKGTLTVREVGDYLGYRSAAAEGDAKTLRNVVARRLDLPLEVTWDVQTKGDPANLSEPFQVLISLDHPKAFRHIGSDWVLTGLGLPAPPDLIQKPGAPRRFPVERDGFGRWTYECALSLPLPALQPVLPSQKDEDAFRTWTWNSEVHNGIWNIRFEQLRKDARFPFDKREEGVKEARRDRNKVKTLLEEGLALKQGL